MNDHRNVLMTYFPRRLRKLNFKNGPDPFYGIGPNEKCILTIICLITLRN